MGTSRVPVLIANATLLVNFSGLRGIISGQQLLVTTSWGPAASCITDNQGLCSLIFNLPPLGGANTITATYDGNQNFQPCAATIIV